MPFRDTRLRYRHSCARRRYDSHGIGTRIGQSGMQTVGLPESHSHAVSLLSRALASMPSLQSRPVTDTPGMRLAKARAASAVPVAISTISRAPLCAQL